MEKNELIPIKNNWHFQARKTHCPLGHPYTVENTKITMRKRHGGLVKERRCKECLKIKKRRAAALRATNNS